MSIQIVTLAGSIREGSLNAELARAAASTAGDRGAEGTFLDLSRYLLPLYNADLESSRGVPDKAVEIAQRVMAADALIIASPEYNGAYTALLKNTIDWVTRVDFGAWARPTALMSATPGRTGGRRGLQVLRLTLANMNVPLLERQVTVPQAQSSLSGGLTLEAQTQIELEAVIDDLISSVLSRAA